MCNNHANWKSELADAIDDVLEWIQKEDKYDKIVDLLSESLLKTVTAEQNAAIQEAIKFIESGSGDITADEIDYVLAQLESKLSTPLAEKVKSEVAKYSKASYARTFNDMGIEFAFNQVDQRALTWLTEDTTYWIGNQYGTEISEKMRIAASDILNQGFAREESGALFKEAFKNEFTKTENYWDGLSNHVVTKSRSFGQISAFEAAGIEEYEWMSILDMRTSAICRQLNGRIFSVSAGRGLIDRMMDADTPEKAKEISPFLGDKFANTKVKGVKTSALPDGIGFPPGHWLCRSRLRAVLATDNIIESKVFDENLSNADKKTLSVYSDAEYSNWINGIKSRANKAGLSHYDSVESKSAKLANSIIGDPNNIAAKVIDKDVQFIFVKDGSFAAVDKSFTVSDFGELKDNVEILKNVLLFNIKG